MFLDLILGQKLVLNHWFTRSNSMILEDVWLTRLHQAFKKHRLKSLEIYTFKFSRWYWEPWPGWHSFKAKKFSLFNIRKCLAFLIISIYVSTAQWGSKKFPITLCKFTHSQVVMHHHYKVIFIGSNKLNTKQVKICQKRPSPREKNNNNNTFVLSWWTY